MQRRNALSVILRDSHIVEVAGCLNDVKTSWLTTMVKEHRLFASKALFFVLFCAGQKEMIWIR